MSVLNEENIVGLTNAARKSSRLVALAISPKLEKAAQEKAKDILEAAIIGLVLVLAAYAITRFVFSVLAGGTA